MGLSVTELQLRSGDTGINGVAGRRFAGQRSHAGIEWMNKADVIDRVADRTGLGRRAAESAVNAILSVIGDALSRGDVVRIYGFGRFSVRTRPAHAGRNPGTGERIPVRASKTPLFKAGKQFKDAVNRGGILSD